MQKPSWKVRRRIIHLTLLFCAGCVLYAMAWGDATRSSVLEIIVMCSFGLAFAVIGSYIFGAVWDDKNFMSTVKPKGQSTDNYVDSDFPPDPNEGA